MESNAVECGVCFADLVVGICENCECKLRETCFRNHTRANMFSSHIIFPFAESYNPRIKSDLHDAGLLNERISTLRQLDEEIDRIVSKIEENRQLNDQSRSRYVKEMNAFHEELVLKLKLLITEAQKEGDDLHKQNTDIMDEISLKCKDNRQELRKQIDLLDELESKKHYRHLFIALKKDIASLNDKNTKCVHENYIKEFEFARNSHLDKIIREDLHLGTLTLVCDGSEEVTEHGDQETSVAVEKMRDKQNEEQEPVETGSTEHERLEQENLQHTERKYDEAVSVKVTKEGKKKKLPRKRSDGRDFGMQDQLNYNRYPGQTYAQTNLGLAYPHQNSERTYPQNSMGQAYFYPSVSYPNLSYGGQYQQGNWGPTLQQQVGEESDPEDN